MKAGLALIPELAHQASKQAGGLHVGQGLSAAATVAAAAAATVTVATTGRVAFTDAAPTYGAHGIGANATALTKVYKAKPEPLRSVIKTRTVLTVLGRK